MPIQSDFLFSICFSDEMTTRSPGPGSVGHFRVGMVDPRALLLVSWPFWGPNGQPKEFLHGGSTVFGSRWSTRSNHCRWVDHFALQMADPKSSWTVSRPFCAPDGRPEEFMHGGSTVLRFRWPTRRVRTWGVDHFALQMADPKSSWTVSRPILVLDGRPKEFMDGESTNLCSRWPTQRVLAWWVDRFAV